MSFIRNEMHMTSAVANEISASSISRELDFLRSDIASLGMSRRVTQLFRRPGFSKVCELALFTEENLKKQPGCGPKSQREVITALRHHGYKPRNYSEVEKSVLPFIARDGKIEEIPVMDILPYKAVIHALKDTLDAIRDPHAMRYSLARPEVWACGLSIGDVIIPNYRDRSLNFEFLAFLREVRKNEEFRLTVRDIALRMQSTAPF
jgi:hypothetical protein